MKPRDLKLLLGWTVIVLALLACNLPQGGASIESAGEPLPTEEITQAPQPGEKSGTVSPLASDCPAVSVSPSPSGLIASVTMAEGTSGEERTPVNPTTTYASGATFHAVVGLVEAPANTVLRAVWYAGDTGGVAECNTEIDSYELTTDGTRNIDFSLTPQSQWPSGSYRIEVFVNNVLDQAVYFSVK
jgi:hypothetical protein